MGESLKLLLVACIKSYMAIEGCQHFRPRMISGPDSRSF